jgi:hypothetical protein
MADMDEDGTPPPNAEAIDEAGRSAAISRLQDLYSDGTLAFDQFSGALGSVIAASSHSEMEAAMGPAPSLVRRTPPSRRLTDPLVVRTAVGGLRLGAGWQLAADTTVVTGVGTTLLDLAAASWDCNHADLRLETWGAIELLVPCGVTVQLGGGCADVQLASLDPPVPGGPLLRVHQSGPTGSVRIAHPGVSEVGRRIRQRRRGGRARQRR